MTLVQEELLNLKILLRHDDLEVVKQGITLWEAFIDISDVEEFIIQIEGVSARGKALYERKELFSFSQQLEIFKSFPHKVYISLWVLGWLVQFEENAGEHLRNFQLDNRDLEELPDNFGAFTELKILDLSRNKLSFLPEAVGKLKKLERLILKTNDLTELPDCIGGLQSLEELDCSWNKISTVSEKISALKRLWHLDLYENNLSEFPEGVAALSQLKKLNIGANQLIRIPESITSLREIEDLALYSNYLSELPEQICELGSLKILRVGNQLRQKLTKLPENIGSLRNLVLLSADFSKLSSLPETILALENLEVLSLSKNELSFLPKDIGSLKKLKVLNIRSNQLTELPKSLTDRIQSIGENSEPFTLDVEYNPLPIGLETELKRRASPQFKIII